MKFLVSLGVLISLCHGYISRNNTKQIVLYWGQDSAGTVSTVEKPLGYYCQKGNYGTIIMAFMISFIDARQPNCGIPNGPDLNFANHGNLCVTYPNCPFLLNCTTTIGVDIQTCQNMGVNILLSLGGAVGSYGFTSDTQASSFADTIWNMFFEGTNNNGIRPFGMCLYDNILIYCNII